jgi:hypothetical protein
MKLGTYISVTYKGLSWRIIMGYGVDDRVYWHFFTITVNYYSSHIELLLNDVCLINFPWRISHCCLNLGLVSTTLRIESESYVTTDGQPASLSWNKAPFWCLRPDLYYCMTLKRVYWYWAHSLTRGRVNRLQFLLVLASAVIFGSESRRTRGHILLSQIWDFPFRRLLRLAGSRWKNSTPPPLYEFTNPHPFITATRP